ncbi:hypothetical protein HanXRQr2_Chr09g0398531 [Helianthus annuus]|uniref:Uncharacterized protein n=1 Tax=Helianthus annuus TaxID=4232 RepID=A0A9K3N9N2_HELAN|nr:hypothetical protein HanXRQr2_Chr09g0398531 [Helianthus annuus]KAJ0894012.1 hypothetical protein HanPSC8_Chr09g0384291 [Helianthus annuus]
MCMRGIEFKSYKNKYIREKRKFLKTGSPYNRCQTPAGPTGVAAWFTVQWVWFKQHYYLDQKSHC